MIKNLEPIRGLLRSLNLALERVSPIHDVDGKQIGWRIDNYDLSKLCEIAADLSKVEALR